MRDVTAPIFNPHGGPITHSSTGSKPDSPVPPCTQGCSSRVASYVIHEPPSIWYQTNTYSRGFEPLSHFVSGNERLPMCLKLLFCTFLLCSRYFLKFQFESYFRHPPRCYRPDSQTCRGPFSRNTHPLSFRKYDGTPKKGRQTSSWWPEGEDWRHQCNGSTSSRRATMIEKNR